MALTNTNSRIVIEVIFSVSLTRRAEDKNETDKILLKESRAIGSLATLLKAYYETIIQPTTWTMN